MATIDPNTAAIVQAGELRKAMAIIGEVVKDLGTGRLYDALDGIWWSLDELQTDMMMTACAAREPA